MSETKIFSPRKFDQIVSDTKNRIRNLDEFDMAKLAVDNLVTGSEKTLGVKIPELKLEVHCKEMTAEGKILF